MYFNRSIQAQASKWFHGSNKISINFHRNLKGGPNTAEVLECNFLIWGIFLSLTLGLPTLFLSENLSKFQVHAPDPFIISKSRELNQRVTLNVGGVRHEVMWKMLEGIPRWVGALASTSDIVIGERPEIYHLSYCQHSMVGMKLVATLFSAVGLDLAI